MCAWTHAHSTYTYIAKVTSTYPPNSCPSANRKGPSGPIRTSSRTRCWSIWKHFAECEPVCVCTCIIYMLDVSNNIHCPRSLRNRKQFQLHNSLNLGRRRGILENNCFIWVFMHLLPTPSPVPFLLYTPRHHSVAPNALLSESVQMNSRSLVAHLIRWQVFMHWSFVGFNQGFTHWQTAQLH